MQTPRSTAAGAAGWLTAREAAARLGVSLPTLYSYVSRDLLHPLAAREAGAPAGARGKRYRRSEVERLARRHAAAREPRRVAGAALDFALPVLESGLCLIEHGRFHYRGQDALQL
ncbi:MAG: helix-turn-helix domain-containing protein, partial [Burkholderiales bacterium]|nr:helix-turn-helix domain-containing protein [Burkholderiales bacterium]